MKFIALAIAFCATFCQINAATTVEPEFREKYDHLWLEWVNEKIREGEMFLERINSELLDYQRTHNEAERLRLENEIQLMMSAIKISLSRFEIDLKAPGLDLLEKYTLEKAKAGGEVVLKLLTEAQKVVEKKP